MAVNNVAQRSMQLAEERAQADIRSDELEADRQRALEASWLGGSWHGMLQKTQPKAAAARKLFQRSNSTDQ
jgi:hypothetical protein